MSPSNLFPLVLAATALAALSAARADLADALDTTLPVSTYGNAVWFDQSVETFDTVDAAQSGAITHDESSTVSMVVNGPARVTFQWKVSSEEGVDFLNLYVDSSFQSAISGDPGWQEGSVTVGAGPHVVEWTYEKDGSVTEGIDAGWVDQVVVEPVSITPNADLAEALDTTLDIFTSGAADWFNQVSTTYNGGDAAQSGDIEDSQTSTMSTTFAGPGTLSFWWNVSSEENFDFLRFYVNSILQDAISGEAGWTLKEVVLGAGSHTVEWRYEKDGSVTEGIDAGWVDQLSFVPVSTPPNDDFANRLDLGSGGLVSTAGNNVAAGLELDEPPLTGYDGNSVWWSWTAPADGWTCIDTAGSAIDTTVAVYTGTVLDSLTQVGWSSGSFFNRQARLCFEATAGATYQIAVHGNPFFNGSVPGGDIELTIDNGYVPPADIIAMSMNPTGGEVGFGPVSFALNVSIDSVAGLDEVEVFLLGPSGQQLDFHHFGAAQLVSGDANSGTYLTTVNVPGYFEQGDCRLQLELIDVGDNRALVSDGTGPDPDHAEPGLNFTWTADNNGTVDRDPPVLTAITFSPPLLNLFEGQTTVQVDLAIEDIPAGLGNGVINLFDPSGGTPSQTAPVGPFNLVSGDANSGLARVSFNIGGAAPLGTWSVDVTLWDELGNQVVYGGFGEPFPGGSEGTFDVIDVFTLDNAVDTPILNMGTSGAQPWFPQELVTHDGVDAAQSGDIEDNQSSTLSTTVVGPVLVSFWWQVSCEDFFDKLIVSLDGSQVDSISGEVSWTANSVFVPAGSHSLAWTYSKDFSVSIGDDAGWLDEVVVTPVSTPDNDAFADARLLSGASASDTGDNTYAALEADEPSLGAYDGASLWWKWTAPADGWVRVDTAGSAIPTTLAAYEGSLLSTVANVGWTSGTPHAPQAVLTFYAMGGTTYHLAVHGNPFQNSNRVPFGSVAIVVQSGITPEVALTGLTLTPGSGDVGSGPVSFTANATITCAAMVSTVEALLYSPSGNLVDFVALQAGDPGMPLSGTLTAGVFSIPLQVPGNVSPGAYRVRLEVTDGALNEANYSDGTGPFADHARADFDFTFDVSNSGAVDASAPDLVGIAFTPPVVNIYNGDQTLQVDLTVTDALSGLSDGLVYLYDSSDNYQSGVAFNTALATLVSGDVNAGTWRIPVTVPGSGPVGTWRGEVELFDFEGNRHYYGSFSGGDTFPGGDATAQFTVENVEVIDDYAAWAAANGIPGEPAGSDFDKDGIPNGVEALLGTDPTKPDPSGPAATVTGSAAARRLVITFDRVADLPDNLVIRVKMGDSPSSLVTVAEKTGDGAWSGPAAVNETTLPGGKVQVTVDDVVTGKETRFGTVEVGTN